MCWNNVPISLRRRARHVGGATVARELEIAGRREGVHVPGARRKPTQVKRKGSWQMVAGQRTIVSHDASSRR